MWILDKWGNAINADLLTVFRCDSEKAPFQVTAWLADLGGDGGSCFTLAEFETRAEAKDYIKNRVRELNYLKTKGLTRL